MRRLAARHPATLARGRVILAGLYRLSARTWVTIRGHLVTVVAFALVAWAAFLVWMPAGLVISALCLLVLERKVELDRR